MRKKIENEKNISYDDEKGLYYVSLSYGKNPDTGKYDKVYRTFNTLKEAKKARDLHRADRTAAKIREKEFQAPKKLTIEKAIEQFFELEKAGDRAIEPTTKDSYKRIFDKYFLPFCQSISKQYAKDVQRKDFQKYFSMLEAKGLSGETKRKHYSVLKSLYYMLEKDGVIERNPLYLIDKPKRNPPPPKNVCSYEEAAKMILEFQGDYVEVAVLMGLYMGMRREEIAGLKWENVDLDKKYLSIVSVRTQIGSTVIEKCPKTRSSARTLYIPERVLNLLKRLKSEQETNQMYFGSAYKDGGYVFVQATGEPYIPAQIYQHMKLIQQKAGLRHFSVHDLRKSFASTAYATSNDILSIKYSLGHHPEGVTGNHYIRISDTHSKKMIQAVEQVYETAVAAEIRKRKDRAA